MNIRLCINDDILPVAAFYDTVVLHLEQTVNYPKWEYGVYPSRQSVERVIKLGVQYLCEDNGQILGAFVLNEEPQGAYEKGDWEKELKRGEYLVIHTLAVDPECRGRGVGKEMVSFCQEEAIRKGNRALRIDVVPGNIPAIRLYERMGFVFAGQVDLERDIPEIPEFALFEKTL